jgi:hypothetical protein
MYTQSLKEDCPYHCNKGYVFLESRGRIECPYCLGIENRLERTDVNSDTNIYKELNIPKTYWGISENDCYAFIDDIAQLQETYGATTTYVVETCRNVLDALKQGGIYRDSLYINMGVRDIDKFVYSAQVLGALHGVGTVPYITVNRLALLLYSGDTLTEYDGDGSTSIATESLTGRNATLAMRVKTVMHGIDYWDYVSAPLVFLEITAGITDSGYLALLDLLAERSKMCLPTYVIGFCAIYKRALNGEFLTLGQYEGKGLRKLTSVSLVKNTNNFKNTMTENQNILATLSNYKTIEQPISCCGIKV